MVRTSTACLLVVGLVACIVLYPMAVHSSDGDATPMRFNAYRCQRPFSAMSNVAKSTARDNCDLTYFSVADGHSEVICSAAEAAGRSKDALDCNVTLHMALDIPADIDAFVAERVGDVSEYESVVGKPAARSYGSSTFQRTGKLLAEDDVWRYSLQIRALGHSTVSYKGYDGEGYSLCCEGMEEAECSWVHGDDVDDTAAEGAAPLHVMHACPLPSLPRTDGTAAVESGRTVHVVVRRPLHRMHEGRWEAKVEVWRRRPTYSVVEDGSAAAGLGGGDEHEVLGRIVFPFTVSAEELWSGQHVWVNAAAGSAEVETKEGAVVVQDDKAADEL